MTFRYNGSVGTNTFSVWFVSNCEKTSGARARWEYGKQLIQAGLEVTGYGQGFIELASKKSKIFDS